MEPLKAALHKAGDKTWKDLKCCINLSTLTEKTLQCRFFFFFFLAKIPLVKILIFFSCLCKCLKKNSLACHSIDFHVHNGIKSTQLILFSDPIDSLICGTEKSESRYRCCPGQLSTLSPLPHCPLHHTCCTSLPLCLEESKWGGLLGLEFRQILYIWERKMRLNQEEQTWEQLNVRAAMCIRHPGVYIYILHRWRSKEKLGCFIAFHAATGPEVWFTPPRKCVNHCRTITRRGIVLPTLLSPGSRGTNGITLPCKRKKTHWFDGKEGEW